MALRIASAYVWALVPEQPDPARPAGWTRMKAEGSQEGLADRVSVKLRQNGMLATTYGARNVRMDLDGPLASLWESGHVTFAELWACYRRYPYLTRLRDRSVLEQAVASVVSELLWETEGFAVADAYDEAAGRYLGLVAYNHGSSGTLTDETLIVEPEVAAAQLDADAQARDAVVEASSDEDRSRTGPTTPMIPDAPEDATGEKLLDVRFFGAATLDPERYARDFNKVVQEVLQHLTAVAGTQLEVSVEVTATNPAGFPQDKVRIVTENARTLKFDQFGFEDR